LLASPPPRGDLQPELERLAAKTWRHPITSAPTTFGLSTIEHWYYGAKNAPTDPVGRLRKKLRKDLGKRVAITDALAHAIHALYAAHRSWSYQLHYDNLVAWADADQTVGAVPAYATVRRYITSIGLLRRRKIGGEPTEGKRRAEQRLDEREVRSYENEYVNGLWLSTFTSSSPRSTGSPPALASTSTSSRLSWAHSPSRRSWLPRRSRRRRAEAGAAMTDLRCHHPRTRGRTGLVQRVPSVNRFGSRQAQAAFAAPKSRMDRPILQETVRGRNQLPGGRGRWSPQDRAHARREVTPSAGNALAAKVSIGAAVGRCASEAVPDCARDLPAFVVETVVSRSPTNIPANSCRSFRPAFWPRLPYIKACASQSSSRFSWHAATTSTT